MKKPKTLTMPRLKKMVSEIKEAGKTSPSMSDRMFKVMVKTFLDNLAKREDHVGDKARLVLSVYR